jgi:hypothetical protein
VLRAEQYRRFARACLEIARNVEDERTWAALVHTAHVWFRLAEEHVNETDIKQSAVSFSVPSSSHRGGGA